MREPVMFDREHYLAQQTEDLANAARDPWRHYVRTGAAAGSSPHPLFDPVWYGDLAHVSPADALAHYVTTGARDGRSPHPLFDARWYERQVVDAGLARDVSVPPPVHYLTIGSPRGCSPHPFFDVTWYRSAHRIAPSADPLIDYLASVHVERAPHPLVDPDWFWAQLGGRPTGGLAALELIHRPGAADPHPLLWVDHYLATNPDVAAAGADPVLHYLTNGDTEGRQPNPLFDPAVVRRAAGGSDATTGTILAAYVTDRRLWSVSTHRLFAPAAYAATLPDTPDVAPLEHLARSLGASVTPPQIVLRAVSLALTSASTSTTTATALLRRSVSPMRARDGHVGTRTALSPADGVVTVVERATVVGGIAAVFDADARAWTPMRVRIASPDAIEPLGLTAFGDWVGAASHAGIVAPAEAVALVIAGADPTDVRTPLLARLETCVLAADDGAAMLPVFTHDPLVAALVTELRADAVPVVAVERGVRAQMMRCSVAAAVSGALADVPPTVWSLLDATRPAAPGDDRLVIVDAASSPPPTTDRAHVVDVSLMWLRDLRPLMARVGVVEAHSAAFFAVAPHAAPGTRLVAIDTPPPAMRAELDAVATALGLHLSAHDCGPS
jgi:hypothetical protein